MFSLVMRVNLTRKYGWGFISPDQTEPSWYPTGTAGFVEFKYEDRELALKIARDEFDEMLGTHWEEFAVFLVITDVVSRRVNAKWWHDAV